MLSNGFGAREWQSLALTGFASGHTYMGGFYKEGVLAPDRHDPVWSEYRAQLVARHELRAIFAPDRIVAVGRQHALLVEPAHVSVARGEAGERQALPFARAETVREHLRVGLVPVIGVGGVVAPVGAGARHLRFVHEAGM